MIEIDEVRSGLHRPRTEAGDYISDEYLKLIDLSTSPDRTNPDNILRIASAIRRLNRNLATTSFHLVDSELAQPYNDVIDQLNYINEDIVGLDDLQPLITDDSRFRDWSGEFNWGDVTFRSALRSAAKVGSLNRNN